MKKSYVIYDPDRNMYWKPNRMGYTFNKEEAGVYSEEEALEITNQPYVNDYMIEI